MNDLNLPDDLKECIAFHGHLCPGVVIGYCAARVGMRELSTGRAGDEELIAIVENDTCAVDAVQVLTGCTFGKGNLFFRDYGKMAFTFATRCNGRSVRLYLQSIAPPDINKVPEDQRRQRQIEYLLSRDPSEFFEIQKDVLPRLPQTARIHESIVCDRCGETVMSTRLRRVNEQNVCIPCFESQEKNNRFTRRLKH